VTFADQYADHAYADLIREGETQGIGIGASQERERIIALLESLKCACDGECGMVEAPFTVLRELIEGGKE
jgi:phage gp46-like protein